MRKNVFVFILVAVFLVTGTMVMAEGGSSSDGKGMFQCMYNWFSGCDKPCAKTAENNCMCCGKKCCQTCQTDCGGKCCAKCGK